MMNLNLPKSIKDCTVDQLSKWLLITDSIKDSENATDLLIFQCQLLSIFSGESVSSIKKADLYSVQEASTHLLSVLSSYEYKEPKEVIVIEGKSYFYRKDFSHISTGQIIDLKLIEDIANDPAAVLAIMYVEDGMEYCQEDDRGRQLNPTGKRYTIFKSHFPGDEFLNFFTFFFHYLEKQSLATIAIQTARIQMQTMILVQDHRIQNGTLGPRSYIDYPKRWDAVWKELQNNLM